MASSNGRRQPVFSLWPLALCAALRSFLEGGATCKVAATPRRSIVIIGAVDPCFNVNTPEDLAEAERMLEGLKK